MADSTIDDHIRKGFSPMPWRRLKPPWRRPVWCWYRTQAIGGPAQVALFVHADRAAQCSQAQPDLVVGMIAGDVTLRLSGSFTQSSQFTIGALATAPTVGIPVARSAA
ncbi:hypothetical protein [Novacetimonas hansenii]|uniref:hypothetical protein n=1 Tax=Novacetimonas hansenii TaxID=436 RepID=UPI001EF086A5|nr:hypothetical protein [Novacetimonas hansenii]